MEPESGCKDSPVWLIGDSPPERWKDLLSVPLDSRHPARHNIWTPIVDGIQERVFQCERLRVDTSRLYVRNAVDCYKLKEEGRKINWKSLNNEAEKLGELLECHEPPLVFTFGAFAFEFARRSLGEDKGRAYSYWSAKQLGKQFRDRTSNFSIDCINLIPLLHVSIARGKFMVAHHHFTCDEDGNYFDYVASKISNVLLCHKDALCIWVS